MKVNIFKGSRRVAALLAVFWGVGWAAHAIFADPYYSAMYVILHPGGTPLALSTCEADDAREYITRELDGRSVGVTLCFRASKATDGRKLIPVVEKEGRYWMNEKYSSEVMSYTRMVAAAFTWPAGAEAAVREGLRSSKIESAKESLKVGVIGIAVWAVFVWCVGWIVRGFLGVPSGADFAHAAVEDEPVRPTHG